MKGGFTACSLPSLQAQTTGRMGPLAVRQDVRVLYVTLQNHLGKKLRLREVKQ